MKEKLDRAIALMEKASFLEDQLSRASQLRERLYGRELIISVIGQFKRGKSSLINALLGDALLPVGIIPLTTTVTEIRYGSGFRAVVCFMDGSEQEIGRDELPDYISEQKNSNNHKDVAAVKLWTTQTPFGPGITLVDTPGVGSVHQHNTKTSNEYIEKSDAVLFLLSVDSPVSETEREFLLKTRDHAAKFYFAVNKTDTISEENLKEFLLYCKAILSEAIGLDVTLYPVSTKTGEGVSALAERLTDDLRGSYDALLEASVSIKLSAILAQAKAKLALYLKAAAIPADELETKLARIREKQSELNAFSDEVQILAKRQTERLVERIQVQLDIKIAGLRPEMEAEAEGIFSQFKALPSRQFETQFLAGIEAVMRGRLAALNDEGLTMLNDGYTRIVGALNEKATETAGFVSGMVKEQFGLDYPISVRTFSVSERSDFFILVGQSGGFLIDTDAFTHLLPRDKANKKIYDRVINKLFDDLDRNKNNMVYNYRYKMQESLRTMCAEFIADISQMSGELNRLLAHVERDNTVQSVQLRQTEEKYTLLMRELDGLG